MKIQELFSALIFALSVSTLLLTLTAYFIHRLKTVKAKSNKKEIDTRESIFFVKYDPHYIVETRVTQKKGLLSKFEGTVPIFSVLLIFIFTFVLYSQTDHGEIELVKREERAQTYKDLLASGELKLEKFSPVEESSEANHTTLLESSLAQVKNKQLAQYNILLINLAGTENKDKQNKTNASFERLKSQLIKMGGHVKFAPENFLKNKQIEKSLSTWADAIVLSGSAKISSLENQGLENILSLQKPVLVMGFLATDKTWQKKHFEIEFAKERHPLTRVYFSAAKTPWWNINGGESIELQNPSQFRATHNSDSITESAFLADNASEIVDSHKRNETAAQFIEADQGKRLAWLALSPEDFTKYDYKENEALRSTLLWLVKAPQLVVHPIPDGKDYVLIPTLEVLREKEIAENFSKLLSNSKQKGSILLDSKIYKDHRLECNNSDSTEWASKVDFAEVNKNEQKYYLLQDSLIDSSICSKAVSKGVYLGGDRDLIKNRQLARSVGFQYLFTNKAWDYRLETSAFSNDFSIISNESLNDIQIFENPLYGGEQGLRDAVNADIEKAKLLKSNYILSMHDYVFGKAHYMEIVQDILENLNSKDQDSMTMKLMDWASWKLSQANLKVGYSKETGLFNIQNNSDKPLSGLVVFIADDTDKGPRAPASIGQAGKVRHIEDLAPAQKVELK